METTSTPGYRTHYNVNEKLEARNRVDVDNNPTGGYARLLVGDTYSPDSEVLKVRWQDGPRGREDGTLAEPNGAFVEDVLWVALQRLEFFNEGKYRDRANSIAITKIEEALQALKNRQLERSYRGVEIKHEV